MSKEEKTPEVSEAEANETKANETKASETKASEAAIRDAEIEREIRSRRKFSLAEAIGRSAGDLLKGASPVTRRQQAVYRIEEILDRDLRDPEGALGPTLLRRVQESEELLGNYDDPATVLSRVVVSLLSSDDSLERFVGKVDAAWGAIYLERPYFDSDTETPHRDDPYTRDSVRMALRELLEALDAAPDDGS